MGSGILALPPSALEALPSLMTAAQNLLAMQAYREFNDNLCRVAVLVDSIAIICEHLIAFSTSLAGFSSLVSTASQPPASTSYREPPVQSDISTLLHSIYPLLLQFFSHLSAFQLPLEQSPVTRHFSAARARLAKCTLVISAGSSGTMSSISLPTAVSSLSLPQLHAMFGIVCRNLSLLEAPLSVHEEHENEREEEWYSFVEEAMALFHSLLFFKLPSELHDEKLAAFQAFIQLLTSPALLQFSGVYGDEHRQHTEQGCMMRFRDGLAPLLAHIASVAPMHLLQLSPEVMAALFEHMSSRFVSLAVSSCAMLSHVVCSHGSSVVLEVKDNVEAEEDQQVDEAKHAFHDQPAAAWQEGEEQGGEEDDMYVSASAASSAARHLLPRILQLMPARLLQLLQPMPTNSKLPIPILALQLRRYLMCWSLLLDLLSVVSEEKRGLVVRYLRELTGASDIFGPFFLELFEHVTVSKELIGVKGDSLPQHVKEVAVTAATCLVHPPHCQKITNDMPRLRAILRHLNHPRLDDIEIYYGGLASRLYYRTLKTLPVLSRNWWRHCDRGLSASISKLTTRYFSPLLLDDEIEAVRDYPSEMEDFRIRANRYTSEVVANFIQDEFRVVMKLKLPASYPLALIDVAFAEKSGIVESRARRWLLTVSAMVNSQNARLVEALMVWKRSMDNHLEGIEECPICYSVLHPSTQALPRLACRTCNHKFHAACLYKWFNTSHSCTCPLCRSIF
eukprot:TRINITY_DN6877_c0_g1_i5.p1 TRINITY_DN6877_c0_g1~~TRINITY_DN6877_c0_g1_i5.p1  ORF type:complete len:734 (-),score=208.69 TRINITY_DN6877_c0_g1_i5:131-2332(-)